MVSVGKYAVLVWTTARFIASPSTIGEVQPTFRTRLCLAGVLACGQGIYIPRRFQPFRLPTKSVGTGGRSVSQVHHERLNLEMGFVVFKWTREGNPPRQVSAVRRLFALQVRSAHMWYIIIGACDVDIKNGNCRSKLAHKSYSFQRIKCPQKDKHRT